MTLDVAGMAAGDRLYMVGVTGAFGDFFAVNSVTPGSIYSDPFRFFNRGTPSNLDVAFSNFPTVERDGTLLSISLTALTAGSGSFHPTPTILTKGSRLQTDGLFRSFSISEAGAETTTSNPEPATLLSGCVGGLLLIGRSLRARRAA